MHKNSLPDLKELTLNQRVALVRRFMGYSQNYMAEYFGMKNSTYSQKERKGTIDCDFLIKYCDLFDIDIRLMLYGEVPPTEPIYITVPAEPPKSNPMPEFKLSKREENLLSILSNFSAKKRNLVYEFVDQLRKKK